MRKTGDYLLRYAAGASWLVKTDWQGEDYKAPLMINEAGARIWKGIEEGLEAGELAKQLQEQYQIDEGEALADVEHFIGRLREHGILSE